ncbi:MAG: hypothetical protein U0169_03035 [Polyangiaceae bacterium]
MTKKKRPRTERRDRERALDKLAEGRTRLARLETGGDPSRPVAVASASVVEVHAESLPCLRCAEATRVDEHKAVTVDGRALRVVTLRCRMCGTTRDVWFTLEGALPN